MALILKLSTLFCWIFCIFQIKILLFRYFKHETEFNLILVKQRFDYLPGLTIGIKIENIRLRKRSNNTEFNYITNNHDACANPKTVDEIDFIGKEIKYCIAKVNKTFVNCSDIAKPNYRWDDEYLYITYFARSLKNYSDNRYMFDDQNDNDLIQFQIKSYEFHYSRKYACAYMHEPHYFYFNSNRCKMFVKRFGFIIEFERNLIVSSKPVNDVKNKCLSRYDCLNQCYYQILSTKCNSTSTNIIERNNAHKKALKEMEKFCLKKCKQSNCDEITYEIDIDYQYKLTPIFIIRKKTNLLKKITYLSKINLLDLFITIGSTIAFWLNFSNYNFLISFYSFLFKLRFNYYNEYPLFHRNDFFYAQIIPRRKHFKIFKTIVFCMCSIFVIYETILILLVYYRKETIVEIYAEQAKYEHIPGITIAFKRDLLERKACLLKFTNSSCKMKSQFNVTFSEVSKIEQKCFMHKFIEQNCKDVLPIRIHLENQYILYTFFYLEKFSNKTEKEKLKYYALTSEPLLTFPLFSLRSINQSAPNRAAIYENEFLLIETTKFLIHRNNIIPSMTSNHFFLNARDGLFEYQTITYKSIKSCIDISEVAQISEETCLNQCYLSASLLKYNKFPLNSFIDLARYEEISFLNKTEEVDFLNENEQYCNARCSKSECEMNQYKTKLLHSNMTDMKGDVQLKVSRPISLHIHYINNFLVSLTETINNIFGIIGFIFGWSLLSLNKIKLKIKIFPRNFSRARKKKMKKFIQKVFKYICLAISLCFFSIQISLTLDLFLKFEISVEVNRNINENSDIKPQLSVSGLFIDLFKPKLKKEDRRLDPRSFQFLKKCIYLDIIENCDLYSSSCKLESIDYDQLLVSYKIIFKRNRSHLHQTNLTRKIDEYLFKIKLRPVMKHLVFELNSINSRFIKRSSKQIVLFFKKRNKNSITYSIAYDTISYYLLPYPYSTKCIDYNKKGFKSQHDCLEKCMSKFVNQHCKQMIDYEIVNGSNTTLMIYKKQSCHQWRKNEKICSIKCSAVDCVNTVYMPFIKDKTNKGQTISVLKPKNQMNIEYKLKPKLTSIDFLICIGNIVGICFGLNVDSAITELLRQLAKIISLVRLRFRSSHNN